MRRSGELRGLWVQVVVGLALLSSRKGTQSSRDAPGPAASPATEARASAGAEDLECASQSASTESETGAGETGEVGGSETGDASGSETGEVGGSETGEAESETGARLCSRPYDVSSSPGKGSRAMGDEPSAAANAAARKQLQQGLEVSIDARPPQRWTTKAGVSFDGLDPATKHQIEIRDSRGKRYKTLVLDFERRGSEDICLGMNSFYGSLQLRALRPGARCGPCTTRPR